MYRASTKCRAFSGSWGSTGSQGNENGGCLSVATLAVFAVRETFEIFCNRGTSIEKYTIEWQEDEGKDKARENIFCCDEIYEIASLYEIELLPSSCEKQNTPTTWREICIASKYLNFPIRPGQYRIMRNTDRVVSGG